jgi:hypothetical protein
MEGDSAPPYPPFATHNGRYDYADIKPLLLAAVDDAEVYWSTFSSFVLGNCSKEIFDRTMDAVVRTREAQLLHNRLLQMIFYNAKFSRVPPPGVAIRSLIPSTPPHEFRVDP